MGQPLSKTVPGNKNHPPKGSVIRVEPIRDLKAIKRIKKLLEHRPRDVCFFTLGINTAYRASELLSLSVGQVHHLYAGDRLVVRQRKTGKVRPTTVNKTVVRSIDNWLRVHPNPVDDAPLFTSQKGGHVLTVPSASRMVKEWCRMVGLVGNYGSHSLRKTWGYHQLRIKGSPIPLLMEAYGHTTQRQTLDYLCIDAEEIRELYMLEL